MVKYIYVIYLCALMLVFQGCDTTKERNSQDIQQDIKLDMYTLDLQDDVYFLMGMDYTLFKKILDDIEVDIYDHVTSVGTFYNEDSLEYMMPSILGVNGNDDYKSVIDKLGTPYYDDPNSNPPSVVYLVRYQTYVKIFFNINTGKVAYISCFQE